MSERFKVDLRGVVDLLSRHLYTSPRVVVRELLQNAVDAITARRTVDPDAPGEVVIRGSDASDNGRLVVTDTGIGLTEAQVHELLATIGRSSKRDELGLSRGDFIGQFGIGMLACFLVTDQIRVVTRSAQGAPAVEWVASSAGEYTVRQLDADAPVGTTVELTPRRGNEEWLLTERVRSLAAHYGELLPYPVSVVGADGRGVDVRRSAPWLTSGGTAPDRRRALLDYGESVLGFRALDVIELSVPAVGLSGAAFVLPGQVSPTTRQSHRVYLKRMLLSEKAEGVLPEWAFFLRCVINVEGLRPTASREALYEDELLESARDALGGQVRDWLVRTAASDPRRMDRFIGVHQLGVKAMATHDDELLELMLPWLTVETSSGIVSLRQLARSVPVVRFTRTADEFRRLATVATAQGVAIVNGGYTFDDELLQRLPRVLPDVTVEAVDADEIAARFEVPGAELSVRLNRFAQLAKVALDGVACDVLLREFDPPNLSALYLTSSDRLTAGAMADARSQASAAWAGVLDSVTDGWNVRPQLILNVRNPLVRRTAELTDAETVRHVVEALYVHALATGRHPIRPADSALLNRALINLVDGAVSAKERPAGDDGKATS